MKFIPYKILRLYMYYPIYAASAISLLIFTLTLCCQYETRTHNIIIANSLLTSSQNKLFIVVEHNNNSTHLNGCFFTFNFNILYIILFASLPTIPFNSFLPLQNTPQSHHPLPHPYPEAVCKPLAWSGWSHSPSNYYRLGPHPVGPQGSSPQGHRNSNSLPGLQWVAGGLQVAGVSSCCPWLWCRQPRQGRRPPDRSRTRDSRPLPTGGRHGPEAEHGECQWGLHLWRPDVAWQLSLSILKVW